MSTELTILIGSLNVGGAESHLVALLPNLAKRGWKISVLVPYERGALAPLLESQGIPVIPILSDKQSAFTQILPNFARRPFRIALCVFHLINYLRRSPPLILHFFLPEAYLFGMLAALLARYRGHTVMSRRSLNNYQKRRPILALCETEFRLHTKTSAILANSRAITHQLQAEGVPQDHVTLIYNGINLTPFKNAAPRAHTRKHLNVSDNAWVLILTANLIPYKGHKDLLTALNLIKNELPENWYLWCAGRDDGIGPSLQTMAEHLGLSNHILWLGSRSDIPDLFSAADIGLLCSHEEGFSNAILEGMAAGLPMVVTDVGGNGEAVIEGETGYVVPTRNPEALGKALLKLLHYPEQAKAFGSGGKQRVETHFSLERCVDAYDAFYHQLMSTH